MESRVVSQTLLDNTPLSHLPGFEVSSDLGAVLVAVAREARLAKANVLNFMMVDRVRMYRSAMNRLLLEDLSVV